MKTVHIFLLILIYILGIVYYKTTKTESLDAAVIVEPRNEPLLVPIVLDTLRKLPKHTKIHIFHGTDNIDMIHKGLLHYIRSGKIILHNMGVSNITIQIYSDMLTTESFWNKINGENILIFQTDSCICSFPDHTIYDYLKHGYVGGPLEPSDEANSKGYQNGGFSLRKKSKMLEALKTKKEHETTWPEDKWYSLDKKDIVNSAPYNLAKSFSVERVYYDAPYGIHKPWSFLKPDELEQLKKKCPEISTIFGK
jgi:hypothetical protein